MRSATAHIIGTLLALVVLTITGCKRHCTDPVACNYEADAKRSNNDLCEYESCNTVDQAALLANLADNVIVPAYATYEEEVVILHTAFEDYVDGTGQPDLAALQEAFKNAYGKWTRVSCYNFGPAGDIQLRGNSNIFPTDTPQIATNVLAGTWDLAAASNADAKGWPALDYIVGAAASQLDAASPDADQWIDYTRALIVELRTNAETVHSTWVNSYAATFKGNTGTDAGSSLSMLVNHINMELEVLKNGRLGIPMGKKSLGEVFPDKIEGYYSGISRELALNNIFALENVFMGFGSNAENQTGIDDYLASIGATHADGALEAVIEAQFDATSSQISQLSESWSERVATDVASMEPAYEEVLDLLVFLKSDMPSALGVLISYQDNDGD